MKVSLREVSESIKYGLTASATIEDTGYKFLRITDIANGSVDFNTVPNVELDRRDLPRYQLEFGDIVIARTGASTGAASYFMGPENVVFASYLVRFRIKPTANSRFVSYVLRSETWKDFIYANAFAKSAQPNLSANSMSGFEFDLPDFETQRAIADVLGALDDKIAANIRVKETCTELIKAIGSIPNSNIPVSELAVQVKKQISAVKLQELDVRHYSIPAFDLGYASIESGDEIKSGKNLIEAPCVLVSKLNPRTPRIWSIPTLDSEETTVCSTEFIAWQGTTVPQAALYAALLQGSFSEQLQERASGTSNSHQRVRPQDIQEATIPDVRKLDQETLKLLEALNLQAADLIKENQALAATRDELLPLLMNGKITVAEAKEAAGDVGVVKQNQQEEGDGSV
ncbi:restriction endonuclease subunit S [Corynebacterium diphtheriae]